MNPSAILLAVTATLLGGPPQSRTPLPSPKHNGTPSRSAIVAGSSQGKPTAFITAETPKLMPQTLTVRFLTDTAYPVTLVAEGLTFACAPEPGSPTPVTACTAQVIGNHVDLTAYYGIGTPLAPVLPRVSGKQWNGACAGTTGDSCQIAMSGPQTVGIDFYAKP